MLRGIFLLLGLLSSSISSSARTEASSENNLFDFINPSDPNIEATLNAADQYYKEVTGKNPWLEGADPSGLKQLIGGCEGQNCPVYMHISKREQRAYLIVDGQLYHWPVSTGTRSYETPNFNRKPNGRVYDAYTSKTYPGGDFNGLGNMPFAVFIEGGFALHGTPRSNWNKLGQRASHGCIRMHPDNAKFFNDLVRYYGFQNTWIVVDELGPLEHTEPDDEYGNTDRHPIPPEPMPEPPSVEEPKRKRSPYNQCMADPQMKSKFRNPTERGSECRSPWVIKRYQN